MKYYIVNQSIDEKIIGKDYPQTSKFIKSYNPDAPDALYSLYKYKESFPNFSPNLDGLMLAGSARLTDFVSSAFSAGYIVSEKAKNILEYYNLCSHMFYRLGLYKRNIKHNYFLLNIVSDYSNFVDYKRSTFIEYNLLTEEETSVISIDSKEDLLKKRKTIKNEKDDIAWTIWGNKIVMSNDFDRELDFFEITRIDAHLYVSERLKEAIELHNLIGWNFTSATNLIVK